MLFLLVYRLSIQIRFPFISIYLFEISVTSDIILIVYNLLIANILLKYFTMREKSYMISYVGKFIRTVSIDVHKLSHCVFKIF